MQGVSTGIILHVLFLPNNVYYSVTGTCSAKKYAICVYGI